MSRVVGEHWVYVLYAPKAKAVKIGMSATQKGAEDRIKTHQTSSGEALHLLGVFNSAQHYSESELHTQLQEWRMRGEWFEANQDSSTRLRELLGISIPKLRGAPGPQTKPKWRRDSWPIINNGHTIDMVQTQPFDVTFASRRNRAYIRTGQLYAYYYINYESITDDYELADISAIDLYDIWRAHISKKDRDAVSISWVVAGCGTFDPHPISERDTTWEGLRFHTWEDDFTTPERIDGKPFRWLDLPIVYKRWNPLWSDCRGKGGFIEELTNFRPNPLQSSVSARLLDNLIFGSGHHHD
jgi:hypothetical protein